MKLKRLVALCLLAVVCLAPACAQGSLADKIKNVKERTYLQTCEKGDSGSHVLQIKNRLQELGYYRASATFDDVFSDTMAQRVRLFQENNSLDVTGKVDGETAQKLYTLNPIRGEYFEGSWNEPDVTLIIPENSYGQWNEKANDRFSFRIKVKNVSTSRSVVAVEYLVYAEDVWENQWIEKDYPSSYTLEETIKPGEMKYTGNMIIPFRSDIYKVYIAINKVRYSDGTIAKVSSPQYWNWTIEW